MTPEQKPESASTRYCSSGWHVCNGSDANIHAATGVAIRECPSTPALALPTTFYVNARGVIEAKSEGAALTCVAASSRYAQGFHQLPAWRRRQFNQWNGCKHFQFHCRHSTNNPNRHRNRTTVHQRSRSGGRRHPSARWHCATLAKAFA